jgi:hypothetical protein
VNTARIHSKGFFWLGVTALASLGLYLLLVLRYPLGPSLADPRASWSSMVGASGWNTALHIAIYLALTLLYLAALRLLTPQGESTVLPHWQIWVICAAWLACSGALMAVAPAGESHDIFDYLFRGRMMVEYQANPLVDVPNEFDLSTPYARYLAWRKNVDTYGPVWEVFSAAVAGSVHHTALWLGWWVEDQPSCPKSPESCRLLILYLTAYRMLSVGLTGLSGWLIASMVRCNQAVLVPLALAAWLLNPLVLIATAVGGHNDTLMLALALVGWWCLQRQQPFLALLALILAAHVKLTALIWLPACGLWIIWRWGWRRALVTSLSGVAVGLAISWLLYAPYGGWQTLPRMLHERSLYLANSPWRILKTLLVERLGWQIERAHRLSVGLPNWLFAASALLIPLWTLNFRPKRWRGTPTPAEKADQMLWRALVATSMLYLVVGSFWFQPWYVLWIIAPTALLPGSRFTRSIMPWLVFGALSANLTMDFLSATLLKTAPPLPGYALAVVMIWGPALIAAATSAAVLRILEKKGEGDSLLLV